MDLYERRREFHDKLCRLRPSLGSCQKTYTIRDYERELNRHWQEEKRTEEEDLEYEYYLWKKYRRGKVHQEAESATSTPQVVRHYYPRNYYSGYNSYYPYNSGYYYPSYGSYYPSYGYGSGNVFNLGMGSGLGIGTPIGGFGIGSFFNIGVG